MVYLHRTFAVVAITAFSFIEISVSFAAPPGADRGGYGSPGRCPVSPSKAASWCQEKVTRINEKAAEQCAKNPSNCEKHEDRAERSNERVTEKANEKASR